MKTDVYEQAVVAKLFYNKDLQDLYLADMILGLFSDKRRRVILFIMQHLKKQNMIISIDNILLQREASAVKKFMRKIEVHDIINEDDIEKYLQDMAIDTSQQLFADSYKILHDEAYANYVESTVADFKYEIAYKNRPAIAAKVRSMQKVYNIIYTSKSKDRSDQIGDAMVSINSSSAYMRLSSNRLTAMLGGFSKGYAAAAIGRPSHNKSTWFTYDSTWQIKSGNLDEVHVIGCEETPVSFWRRVFAIELGIPINEMLHNIRKISPVELAMVKKKYEGKIYYHHIKDFDDIIDLIFSLKVPYLWIDHINGIEYPNGDEYNGIKKLISYEKSWLETNNESVIANLSQVNTKNMKNTRRLFPCKEDAYNSSVLEQASREFLSFYYPYKDIIDKELQHRFAGKGVIHGPDLAQVSIEKNSLGDIGIVDMRYLYEYGMFEDLAPVKGKDNIILGDGTDSLDLFDKLM